MRFSVWQYVSSLPQQPMPRPEVYLAVPLMAITSICQKLGLTIWTLVGLL
jgi:hypothetical protein